MSKSRAMERDERIYEEAVALWLQFYPDPPPRHADGATILDMITRNLPETGYARIATPHLRPEAITFPR